MFTQKGFSLIEILIAIGISSVVLIGALVTMPTVMKVEKKMRSVSGLTQIVQSFRQCIDNEQMWMETLRDPENQLECVFDPEKECDHNQQAYIRLHALAQANGDATYCMGYDSKNENSGFTKNGQACFPGDDFNTGGFNENEGNSRCPYKMRVWWRANCPKTAGSASPTKCRNPIVEIRGKMDYRPDGYNPNLDDKGQSLWAEDDKPRTRIDRYNFWVVRGRGLAEARFTILETKPKGENAGECAGGGVYRQFNETQSDPGQYVLNTNNDGSIELEAGVYDCEISSPAFLVGNHKIVLRDYNNVNDIILEGTSEFAPHILGFTTTRSIARGRISLNKRTRLGVFHFCATTPTNAALRDQTLGKATDLGDSTTAMREVYSIMSCAVVDKDRFPAGS